MKEIIISILFVIATNYLPAQNRNLKDIPGIEFRKSDVDSNFINALINQSLQYQDGTNKPDSIPVLLTRALALANKINYVPGILRAQLELAAYYFNISALSDALNLLIKNEKESVIAGDSISLFNTLRITADLYMQIGDLKSGRKALDKRQYILDHNSIKGLSDTSYYVLSQYNSLARYFVNTKRKDSAEYYYRKMYTSGMKKSPTDLFVQLGSGGLAGLFSNSKNYDSAIYYYRISLSKAMEIRVYFNYFNIAVRLADAFEKAGKTDSAFFYAYKTYSGTLHFGYTSSLLNSSYLLAHLFAKQRKYDSAYKYMNLAMDYRENLNRDQNIKNIQMLTSQQAMRELEIKMNQALAVQQFKARLRTYVLGVGILFLLAIIYFLYRINKQRSRSRKEIEAAYKNLKSTQSQLIQSEKMASLGELTAGIAHEIQNPLNFVNNFSELNQEMLSELKAERLKPLAERDQNLQDDLINDVINNEEKISHHGKRADAIVKSMLQHSRTSSGKKEPTDINALADEYMRLSYHGMRAKDKSFNCEMKTEFDETLQKINVVPQDIGRVLLNLFNNAFYACAERSRAGTLEGLKNLQGLPYAPTVTVSTMYSPLPGRGVGGEAIITVRDNGYGIPEKIKDKIFQPFFTTKPTGSGTGLGLSLSYDIITKEHNGTIKVESKEGEGTEFKIHIPV